MDRASVIAFVCVHYMRPRREARGARQLHSRVSVLSVTSLSFDSSRRFSSLMLRLSDELLAECGFFLPSVLYVPRARRLRLDYLDLCSRTTRTVEALPDFVLRPDIRAWRASEA